MTNDLIFSKFTQSQSQSQLTVDCWVVYIGTEAGNEHYSHIVIDILKGTCEIMDPHADAQMDCIYFEVCNCMGSGVADIV